jgi:hypothetical protein
MMEGIMGADRHAVTTPKARLVTLRNHHGDTAFVCLFDNGCRALLYTESIFLASGFINLD